MNTRSCDLCIRAFWVALGLFVSIYSYGLGIGRFVDPGPGLLPFLLGVLFVVLSLPRLVTVMHQPQKASQEGGQRSVSYLKLTIVVLVLLGWGLLLETLGFLIATFLMMTLLYRTAGFNRLRTAAAWGLGTVLTTYFVFTFLGVRLPPGILRSLGLA